jgi:uncharacterized protein GlcG (DUF336 family)
LNVQVRHESATEGQQIMKYHALGILGMGVALSIAGCTNNGSGGVYGPGNHYNNYDNPDTTQPANTWNDSNVSHVAMKDVSTTQAQALVLAAMQKARQIDTKMNIAVVDAGGNLKAFVRMDGAWLGSIDIAIKKARTARYFDMPSGDIGELSQPGGPLYNIEVSNGGLISFPGGIPLKDADGTIVGAIGVSGSTVDKDHAVAQAGAAALK